MGHTKQVVVALQAAVLCAGCACHTARLAAMERVVLEREGREVEVVGRVVVELPVGDLLLEAPDGAWWVIRAEEVVCRESDARPFAPLGPVEMAARLLDEFPVGFKIHRTAHYVICYNTSDAYAVWCGGLYERLFRGYQSYWKNLGLPLKQPEFPLVALVFDTKQSYVQYAEREIGSASGVMFGYYNMQTNRVTMYDLTGVDTLRKGRRGGSTASHINQILSQPAAERTVATIVHEATHQLAYNTGLETRYAGNPLWVSEGIAVYFETPDLDSARGWRSIGAVNRLHLDHFRAMLERRPPDALETLLTDDARFRDPQTSADAYAEAWALNYFLLRARREPYVRYLQEIGRLPALAEQSSAERVAQFRRAFGEDLQRLDEDLVRFIRQVK